MPILSYGLDARQLSRGVQTVNRQLGSIASTARSVGSKIGGMLNPLNTALAGLGAGFGAFKLAQIGDDYENMSNQLEYLTGSSEEAARAQDLLYQMSQKTRTSVLENSKALTRFQLASEQTGLSIDENVKVLGAINTMMIKTGVSSGEASAAMIQLGQALASGRLQGDEFRSMAENAPALMNELAESLGVSRARLKEMGTEGELTAEVLGKAFLDMANKTEAGAEKLPLTVGGMWTKVVNATQRMWDKINDETGILAWVANGIDNLALWVENNTPRVVQFFIGMRDKAIAMWPQIKQFFIDTKDAFIEVGSTFISVWPAIKITLEGFGRLVIWLAQKLPSLINWIANLIEKMKTLAKYTPLAALARAGGTWSGGGSAGDVVKSFFDADQSMLEDRSDGRDSRIPKPNYGSTVNVYVNQKQSRSDIVNTATELSRYNNRL